MGELLQKISCIIPLYNEQKYIRHVLEVINKAKEISQIICVDDGSTDKTAEVVREFTSVKLIQLERNHGKASAVKKGLEEVDNEYVFLLDADLKNLNADEISMATNAMLQNRQIDMIILRRLKAPWFIRIYRIDTLLSGERLLKVHDLKKVFYFPVSGYQLEIAINLYMSRNNKKVFWSPSSAQNTFKIQKVSPLKAIAKEMSMYVNLVQHAGLLSLFRLMLWFGKEKLPY